MYIVHEFDTLFTKHLLGRQDSAKVPHTPAKTNKSTVSWIRGTIHHSSSASE